MVSFTEEEGKEDMKKEESTNVKKKILIEVIGGDDVEEEKSPNNKKKLSQIWNDFALLLCGMMETSDGLPLWSSKQCSDFLLCCCSHTTVQSFKLVCRLLPVKKNPTRCLPARCAPRADRSRGGT